MGRDEPVEGRNYLDGGKWEDIERRKDRSLVVTGEGSRSRKIG